MLDDIEIKNALITSTTLGIEDHGIMTFYLHLDYGGSGQGAGGYALDDVPERRDLKSKRMGSAAGMDLIMEILRVTDTDSWEKLPGKYIRVKSNWNKVYAIAHPLKDNWFSFETHFKKWESASC